MYKVLIADDEMLDLEGMRRFIPWSELGLEVVAAVHNGYDACDVLNRQDVDILVTDVHMPSMSGLELARKALELAADIRIVFVSGYQDFHYVKEALALKAYSYVLKPMDDAELAEVLRRITTELDEKRRERETYENYRRLASLIQDEQTRSWLEQRRKAGPAADRTKQEGRAADEANSACAGPPGYSAAAKPFKNGKLMNLMIAYIRDNLHRNLTLKEIADRFSFSPNYLGVMFKEETGTNFSEFVTAARMEKAGQLLQNPAVKIYEVAEQVGYRYLPYFSRQFKETFGMTPAQYRRR
ncbi:response regulator [Paenibacillus thailandensis]|uniref:Response regulator n=1 Tax=Paenibacillus thailandensis TaxID=393250 RepID=A0ABW5QR19_9BACL